MPGETYLEPDFQESPPAETSYTGSSFPTPVAPPAHDPLTGPYVCAQIPAEYMPLVLGALAQLLQPFAWDVPDDDTRNVVLDWMDTLISDISAAEACMSLAFRLTDGCSLEYSIDGGTTYTAFTGWADYFCACVQKCVTPPAPAPPESGPDLDQWACNVAGYLTYDVVYLAVKVAVDAVGMPLLGDAVAIVVEGLLGTLLPEILVLDAALATAIGDFISSWVVGNVNSWLAWLADDVVWGKLHCYLYGLVAAHPNTVGNLAAITGAALAAATGLPTTLANGVALILQHLGITTVDQVPLSAFVKEYDCTTCADSGTSGNVPQAKGFFDLTVVGGATRVPLVQEIDFVGATVANTGTAERPKATVTITGGGGGGGGGGSLNVLGGAVDVTIPATDASGSATVAFASSFGTTPTVLLTCADSDYIAEPDSITEGGCTVTVKIAVPDPASDHLVTVYWLATDFSTSGGGGGAPLPFVYTTPPDVTAWTWTNQGASTIAAQSGAYTLSTPGAGGDEWGILTTTPPTAPYTITAAMSFTAFAQNFAFGAIVLRDSGSGKFLSFGFDFQDLYQLGLIQWNDPTSFAGDYTRTPLPMAQVLWLQIENDGTNLTFRFSTDSLAYVQFDQRPVADWLPSIDGIGIGTDANTGSYPAILTLLSWHVA
jgi:hypothetical protein